MSRSLTAFVVTTLALIVALAHVPALAQKSTLAPGVAKASTEPRTIVNQIELAIAEEKKALAGYEAAGVNDSIEDAHQAASNAYVLIRSAREGIRLIRVRKKFDPVMDVVYQRIDTAWNRSRGPVDGNYGPGPARARYMQNSIERMYETIALLEQVLLMWP
jgi:hypothetical protein